jgi:hypothetical protein
MNKIAIIGLVVGGLVVGWEQYDKRTPQTEVETTNVIVPAVVSTPRREDVLETLASDMAAGRFKSTDDVLRTVKVMVEFEKLPSLGVFAGYGEHPDQIIDEPARAKLAAEIRASIKPPE